MDIEALETQGAIEQLEKQLAHAHERLKRNDTCFLILHDLIECAREDVRLKVENAPSELVQALNMALYAIRGR